MQRSSCLFQHLGQPDTRFPGTFWGQGNTGRHVAEQLARVVGFIPMGRCEFENGAVPAALVRMLSQRLVGQTLQVAVPKPNLYQVLAGSLGQAWVEAPAELTVAVHIIAPRQQVEAIKDWIRQEVRQGHTMAYPSHLGMHAYIQNWNGPLAGLEVLDKPTGWLDIHNGLAFFTSHEQWLAVCEVMDVAIPQPA